MWLVKGFLNTPWATQWCQEGRQWPYDNSLEGEEGDRRSLRVPTSFQGSLP
jgi:hypothetical protein